MCREWQYFFFLVVVFFKSLDSLSVNFISGSRFSIKFCGQPLSIKRFLKFELFSSRVVSEEFFLRLYCKLQFGGLS